MFFLYFLLRDHYFCFAFLGFKLRLVSSQPICVKRRRSAEARRVKPHKNMRNNNKKGGNKEPHRKKATSTSFKVMTKTIKECEFCSFYYPCCQIRTHINKKKTHLVQHTLSPSPPRLRKGGCEKKKEAGNKTRPQHTHTHTANFI